MRSYSSGGERQARGRQERQQYSQQRRTNSIATGRPREKYQWPKWPDSGTGSSPAQPAHRPESSAARQRSGTGDFRRRESENARSLLENLTARYNLEKSAWQGRRKLWLEFHCLDKLRQLAKYVVVPREHWLTPFDELNSLLETGQLDNLLPAIEGTDAATRRKIYQLLTWFLEGLCRLDQINSGKLCWPFGRFEKAKEVPSHIIWVRRGKRNPKTGELCRNNSRPRPPSPTIEEVTSGIKEPKHARDTWRGAIELGLPEAEHFSLGAVVAENREEQERLRVRRQEREPVQPIIIEVPPSPRGTEPLPAPLAEEEEPYHNHIQGGPPKVSPDSSTTAFRPAVRRNQQSESSGHGNPPPSGSSGSGSSNPPAAEASSARGRTWVPEPGKQLQNDKLELESRAASTGSSWLLEDRPSSSELEQWAKEPASDIQSAKSPSGETGESDSEDTHQSRYEGPCRDLDARIAATARSKPKEPEVSGELRERLILRMALNNESSDT